MKTQNLLAAVLLALLAFVGAFVLRPMLSQKAMEEERLKTRQQEALSAIAVAREEANIAREETYQIKEEYHGELVLEIAQSQSYVVKKSTDALIRIATEDQRHRESWTVVKQMLLIMLAIVIIFLVCLYAETLRLFLLARLQD